VFYFFVRYCLVTEARVRKAVKAFTENIAAARTWRQVGRSLGVSAEDLNQIGGPQHAGSKASVASTRHKDDREQVREKARQMLEKWRETGADNVCLEQLLTAVKKLKLNDVAGKIFSDVNQSANFYVTHHNVNVSKQVI